MMEITILHERRKKSVKSQALKDRSKSPSTASRSNAGDSENLHDHQTAHKDSRGFQVGGGWKNLSELQAVKTSSEKNEEAKVSIRKFVVHEESSGKKQRRLRKSTFDSIVALCQNHALQSCIHCICFLF